MKRLLTALSLCFLVMFLFASIASAHVVVYPQQSTQGSYEKFTVRVPSEAQNTNTVKVEVRINPADVVVSRIEPKPGWTYALTKDASGAVTSVVWTAQGDGLTPTEFTEFNMQGKVADKATTITWKAYQTYKDGSVVEWVGAPGSDKPASVTKVSAKPAGTPDNGGQGQPAAAATAGSKTPFILSIVAVVLGVISLLISLMRRKA